MNNDKTNRSDSGQLHQDVAQLKPSRIVASVPVSEAICNDTMQTEVREPQIVTNQSEISFSTDDSNELKSVAEDVVARPKKAKKWWVLLILLVVGLSFAEVILAISAVINTDDWLGAGWLVVLFLAITTVLTVVVKEIRSLKRLKLQTETRQHSIDLFNTPAIGLGQEHCAAIGKQLPKQYQHLVEGWQNKLESHYTNNEVLSLFELKVLSPIDKLALNNIAKHSSAAGVMIAVSPFALLDMLIVLWRNIVMINQLSRFYGVRLGYWGRIALIKKIFRSMLYAGAAEILSDAGNYALGVGLTGKMSSRVAQGLGAGVLSTMSNKLLEDLTKFIK